MALSRNEYLQKLESKLSEYGIELEQMNAKRKEHNEQAWQKFHDQVDYARQKSAELKEQLKQAREAGEDKWEQEFKPRLDSAWDSVEDSLKSARDRISSSS